MHRVPPDAPESGLACRGPKGGAPEFAEPLGSSPSVPGENTPLAVELPSAFVEQVAQRVAELLAERAPAPDDGWLRGADRIAAYVGAPRSRVYALAATDPPRIPIHRDGSALVARRSELDAWMHNGGAIRP
jgi:hypothetical protein